LKHAYVSLVLLNQSQVQSAPEIKRVDELLSQVTRKHEIILVTQLAVEESEFKSLELKGPFTVVTTHTNASHNEVSISGLGRSVGDFIIEWPLSSSSLEENLVSQLLAPSDNGAEIIECLPIKPSKKTELFYKLVNSLRPASQPVKPGLARVYSRRALNWVLDANRFETQVIVLVAELPFQKSFQTLPLRRDFKIKTIDRVQDGFALLTKGSRFGTIIPLVLAGISSTFAIAVAIYALLVFLLFGNAADGWTSIAIVTGLGQGAILALIGLVWSRLDSLAKGLSKKSDLTVNVEVYPANS
jgi:hypothetical protein